MDNSLKLDLVRYGEIIQRDGWRAGEAFIRQAARRHEDFRRWAYALGIALRAQELLDEDV